ncbi:MAG: hypothetical protein V1862_05735, partial [Methanobacteriota archaeon]
AFTLGQSTKEDGETRGMGRDILKKFTHTNRGSLELYSNSGHVIISGDREEYHDTQTTFIVTILNISLQRDENIFHFSDEIEYGRLF